MAELADATVSKTVEGNLVGVRLPLSAPTFVFASIGFLYRSSWLADACEALTAV